MSQDYPKAWEEGKEDNPQFLFCHPRGLITPSLVLKRAFAEKKSLEVAMTSRYNECHIYHVLVNGDISSSSKLVTHNVAHNYLPQITVTSVIILTICKKKKVLQDPGERIANIYRFSHGLQPP